MKRLLVIFASVALLLSACSKEKSFESGNPDPGPGGGGGGGGGGGSNTSYFMKCKFDGVAKTFNVGLFATKQSAGGATAYTAAGKVTTGTDPEMFSFDITKTGDLTPGTYSVDNLSPAYTIGVIYITTNESIGYVALSGFPTPNPFKVVVTSVTATEMAGTFSGNVFEVNTDNPAPDPSNLKLKAITEGEFRIKFQ